MNNGTHGNIAGQTDKYYNMKGKYKVTESRLVGVHVKQLFNGVLDNRHVKCGQDLTLIKAYSYTHAARLRSYRSLTIRMFPTYSRCDCETAAARSWRLPVRCGMSPFFKSCACLIRRQSFMVNETTA